MRKFKNILVTGGAGFIGSNFIRYIFEKSDFDGRIINLDCLTYAGNLESLEDISAKYGDTRYVFEKINICDYEAVLGCFEKYSIDCVVHFAAESHVDRSILGTKNFIHTNIVGTFNLLESARNCWIVNSDRQDSGSEFLFHHVSTDEVFGSLDESGFFYETTPYDPRSPYSASKASSDHIVRSYFHTYGFPITMSNCTNNYGAYQFPEKLIPVIILNILEEKTLPVYGDGLNIRDWLFVDDHCDGIWKIIEKGHLGETYNIGGENEWTNIDLISKICEILVAKFKKKSGYFKKLVRFIKDRPGHDRRYAINCDKIKNELGWKQSVSFEEGLVKTIDWYLENGSWINHIQSGQYREWMDKNYINR